MELKNTITKRAYFANLDGLRFIGSLIIIIFHTEDIKYLHNSPTLSFIRYYTPIGNVDVSLFFVLSGFLIAYLLLKEKKENGFINLKAYYTRRTLRIWPLYYFIIILGFFVLPHLDSYFNNTYSLNIYRHFGIYFIGSLLFLSPLVRAAGGLPQTIGPVWSVGVEELFYLCWPIFLKKTRKYLLLFSAIIVFVLILRNGFFLGNDYLAGNIHSKIFHFTRPLIIEYRISCMAIGGIGAYWIVFKKEKILSVIYRKDIQILVYLITFSFLLLRIGILPQWMESFPSFSSEAYSLLFLIIILNLATVCSLTKVDFWG